MTLLRLIAAGGLVLGSLLMLRVAGAADISDDLDVIRRLGQSGAVQLALRRIDMLQPAAAAGAPPEGTSFGVSWEEWERLRLELLAASGRHQELLQRVSALPDRLTGAMRVEFHVLAARSALALGRVAAARDHAGRALWSEGIDATQVRQARLLVIRSYVMEAQATEAYRSMLRFQQDYRPMDTPAATEFVHALLDLGMVREAVNWLGLLDEHGAAKLRLRLHTGLVLPRDAVTRARAALARSDDPYWWRVILDAAAREPAGVLEIEALERLLNHRDQPAGRARNLWGSYAGHAQRNANARQLLAGDEVNWLEFALRRRDAEPAVARAYLGFLARHAEVEAVRRRAQEELAAAFAAAGLPRTALRLFAAWPGDAGTLTVSTRHILGGLALKLDDPERASEYWNGLPAPIDVPLLGWEVRLAALALRAGRAGLATDAASKLAGSRPPITPQLLPEWLALAGQFSDHGLHEGALALYGSALPHADPAQARVVLSGIAQAHEARNQPLLAADYYLRAALRAAAPDAAAADARLRAGLALVRAGLRDDARVQFEWLLRHAKDPAQLSVARRELGR